MGPLGLQGQTDLGGSGRLTTLGSQVGPLDGGFRLPGFPSAEDLNWSEAGSWMEPQGLVRCPGHSLEQPQGKNRVGQTRFGVLRGPPVSLIFRGKGAPGGLPAEHADEAVWVVGLPQGGDHLTLNELIAAEAPGAVEPLVVRGADVIPLPHEEAPLGQVASAGCKQERPRELKHRASLSEAPGQAPGAAGEQKHL